MIPLTFNNYLAELKMLRIENEKTSIPILYFKLILPASIF